MSLEAAIHENTTAINKLIAVMSAGNSPQAENAKVDLPPAAPKAISKAEAPKAASHNEISYDDVKVATLDLAKKNRQAVVDILAKFKVGNAKDLEPARYGDYLKAIREAA